MNFISSVVIFEEKCGVDVGVFLIFYVATFDFQASLCSFSGGCDLQYVLR